jgi:hypothetical protein
MLVGSTEWFYEKSLERKHSDFQNHMEMLRQKFLDKFSSDKLSVMSDSELLTKVFGPNDDSMMSLLIRNDDYKEFGSITQNYTYLGILYYKKGEGWKLYGSNDANKSFSVESCASNIRDELLSCIEVIKKHGCLTSIDAYSSLDKELNSIKYSHYVTFIKYYQMMFPGSFQACMPKERYPEQLEYWD